jgi:hypothetical protein
LAVRLAISSALLYFQSASLIGEYDFRRCFFPQTGHSNVSRSCIPLLPPPYLTFALLPHEHVIIAFSSEIELPQEDTMSDGTAQPISWAVSRDDVEDQMSAYERHVVGLSYILAPGPDSQMREPKLEMVSGFVMSIRGEWMWITAGHAIEQMHEYIRLGYRIVKLNLRDNWQGNPRAKAIPFYFGAHFVHAHDDDKGIDYGIVALGPQQRALLHAGGVIALDESRWSNPPRNVYVGHQVIGFPEELKSVTVATDGSNHVIDFSIGISVAPIRHEPNPPDSVKKPAERFYGVLIDDGPGDKPLKRIEGMSGGPIFGLTEDGTGKLIYWPLAIQSGWLPERRLVIGCPLRVLGETIGNAIDDFIAKRKKAETANQSDFGAG